MNDLFTNGPALWLAQAILLLGCFWAVYGILGSHPRARVMLCRIISVALLALPLLTLAPVPPVLRVPAPKLPNTTIRFPMAAVVPAPVAEPSPSTGEAPSVGEATGDLHPVATSHLHLPVITLAQALVLIWLLGTACLLVRWLLALKMAQRLARSAQEPPEWAHEIQAEIAAHLHLATHVRLGVIDQAGSPFLLGPRPVILLPRHLVEEDAQDDFTPSLVHEMVHVREFDWWWSQWLHLVGAMLWPAPPVWFLRRAHDSAAEIVCDSIAASLVGGTELYAGTLARQSLHALGRPRLAGIPMLHRSGMRQRIDLLLSGFALPALSRRSMMMTGLLALAACGVLSGIRVAADDAPVTTASPTPAATGVAPKVIVPPPARPMPLPNDASAKPALKEIEPYGGISWNDGVFQVIQKIKKIEGITTMTWVSSNFDEVTNIDLTTITTPEELSAAFEKRILEELRITNDFNNPPANMASYKNTMLYQNSFKIYKDISGNDKKYVVNQVAAVNNGIVDIIGNELVAGPIILAGHPFTLHVHFQVYPGFAAEFPDQVIKLPNYEASVAPLAITSVALVTDTNLSVDARNTIADKLIVKYEITDGATISDLKTGQAATVYCKGGFSNLYVDGQSIIYNAQDRPDLQKYYQNLLTKLSEAAAKKGPDGLNGL